MQLNKQANDQVKSGILDLTGKNSKVKILKIPTNEELMIAMETKRIIEK
jgi:acetate kinase